MKLSTLLSGALVWTITAQGAFAQISSDYSNAFDEKYLEQFKHQRCQCKYRSLLARQNPEVAERRRRFEEASDRWIAENGNRLQARGAVQPFVTIPVVVHVVYSTSSDNISDAQIQSQIDVFNEDYRLMNPDFSTNVPSQFQGVAADTEFEFCLASIDPQGNATTGITRHATSTTNIGGTNDVYYSVDGGADAWDPDQYLNIWVADIGGGILGYAYLPGDAPVPEMDGLVIDSDYFGRTGTVQAPLDGGRTGTHEIGHYFNLEHIWGDNPDCNQDDFVGDTPLQAEEYYGCPAHPQNTCGTNDMFMNYMDYTDDNCMGIFTEGQKTRMHAAINTYRSGFFTSNGCGLPASVVHVANDLHVTVSPNPADEMLRIAINTEMVYSATVRLMDLTGRVVLEQSVNRFDFVDVSTLEAGMYLLEVAQDAKTYTQKVVIR